MNDVVISGNICAHRLVAYFEYAAETATDRDGPPLIRCRQPVRCDDWRRSEIPAVGKIIIDERLRQKFVHGGPQRIATNRPLVIEQYTDYPVSRRYQEDGRRAEQKSSGSENRIVGGRNGEDCTRAPDEFTRMRWRKKQRLSNVANSIRVAVKYRIGLTDNWNDNPIDASQTQALWKGRTRQNDAANGRHDTGRWGPMTERVDMSAWTEEEIHPLISLWPASSASQIGARLCPSAFGHMR